jgi:FMN phosphatase YigB (HAD superfamily)
MFLTLARQAGVPSHRVVYIGDNPRADILGARNAGMRTAVVQASVLAVIVRWRS